MSAYTNTAYNTPTSTATSTAATATAATTAATTSRRPPATVLGAVALTGLVTAFGAYGAVYFTGLKGFTDVELTFLVAYEFITLFGLVSAIGMARRSSLARAGVVVYGVWMAVFTLFKVGYIHEVQAIPFGLAGVAILALALSRSARRWAEGR